MNSISNYAFTKIRQLRRTFVQLSVVTINLLKISITDKYR